MIYIRLYSKDSRPHRVIRHDNKTTCSRIYHANCYDHKNSIFMSYNKDAETNYADTDNQWFFQVSRDYFNEPYVYEKLWVGKTYWVHCHIGDAPIEYKIETKNDLKELRAYILSHLEEDIV